MRKLFIMLFAAVVFFPAAMRGKSVTFNVNVANPEAVTLTIDSQEFELVAGDNQLTGEVGKMMLIVPKAGWLITGGTDTAGNPLYLMMNGSYQGYIYPEWEGKTLSVDVMTEEERYPLSCTLTVDNPVKVSTFMQNSFRTLTLMEGTQTVRFNELDNMMYISPASYSEPLYQVTQNGTAVTDGPPYVLTLADGDNIDIKAEYPDIDYNLRFEFVNVGTESVINKFWVGNEEVTDMTPYYSAEGVDVKCNTQIQFSLDNNAYKVNGLEMNGEPMTFYTFRIDKPTVITIDARLWEHPTKKVYIEGSDNMAMYNGYSAWGGIPVEIHEGLNEIVYAEDYSNYAVLPRRDCYLTELRVGDTDLLPAWNASNCYFDFAMEGDVHIKAERYVFDKEMVLYIDDIAAANFGFSFTDNTYQSVEVTSGYNRVPYYDLIAPFTVNAMPLEGFPIMYINDEVFDAGKMNNYMWTFTPVDGNVYKLFIASQPEKFNFTISKGQDADVTVTRDLVVPVSDFTSPLNLLPGTQIDVVAAEGKTFMVSLNDEAPVERNKYTTIANGAGKLVITAASGIEDITAESADAPVYNLTGMRVGVRSDFDKLPAGVYIIAGRKVVKK